MFEDSTPAGPLPQDMLSHGGFFLSQFCATSDSPNFISAVAGIGLDTKKGKCDPARLESESGTEAKTEPETQWGATSQSMHVIGEYNSPLQVLAWVSGIGTDARGDVRTPGCSVGVDDTRKVQQLERGPGGPRYKMAERTWRSTLQRPLHHLWRGRPRPRQSRCGLSHRNHPFQQRSSSIRTDLRFWSPQDVVTSRFVEIVTVGFIPIPVRPAPRVGHRARSITVHIPRVR